MVCTIPYWRDGSVGTFSRTFVLSSARISGRRTRGARPIRSPGCAVQFGRTWAPLLEQATHAREPRLIIRGVAIVRTAFVSTYPPRHCGIATFTEHLASATGNREIVALHQPDQAGVYPTEVHHRVARDDRAAYLRAANLLSDCVDVVSIQHDDRIWGGEDGEYVLDFAAALGVPAVATLHTVPHSPTVRQRAILTNLMGQVAATIVMSRSAASLLTDTYGAEPGRMEVIPHGVPDLPLVDPAAAKQAVQLSGRKVILSFGLVGSAKGYELALDALPAVVAAHPETCYVVLGATHPEILARDGEAYRDALAARVAQLRMQDHVVFVNRFVGRVELTRWLQAADVFLTPYPDLERIVSGSLAYAMAAGRAIVSTPYAYASEQLGEGRGLLFAPGSPDALAQALIEVLSNDELRLSMGRNAHEYSRDMVWPSVGGLYRTVLNRVAGATPLANSGRPMAAITALPARSNLEGNPV
jgi:glycosyltransferase involved in cell wall biosynthesis